VQFPALAKKLSSSPKCPDKEQHPPSPSIWKAPWTMQPRYKAYHSLSSSGGCSSS